MKMPFFMLNSYRNTRDEQLAEENAKLREMVRIMHSELVSCEDNGYVCGGHKFDDRMRDLRIEADG
jgi:hypothetical protein